MHGEGRRRAVVRGRLRRRPPARRLLALRARRRRPRDGGRLGGRRQRRADRARSRASGSGRSPASRRTPGSRRTRRAGPRPTPTTTAAPPPTWSAPSTGRPRTASTCSTCRSPPTAPRTRPRTPSSGRSSARPRPTSSSWQPRATARARSGYAAPWVTTVGAVTSDVRRGLVVRRGAADAARRDGLGQEGRPGAARPRQRRSRRRQRPQGRAALRARQPGRRHGQRPHRAVHPRRRRPHRQVARGPAGRRRRHGAGQRGRRVRWTRTCTPCRPSTSTPRRATDCAGGWRATRAGGSPSLLAALQRIPPRVAGWSRTGDPRLGVVTPDLLADGSGVLAAGRADASSDTALAAGQRHLGRRRRGERPGGRRPGREVLVRAPRPQRTRRHRRPRDAAAATAPDSCARRPQRRRSAWPSRPATTGPGSDGRRTELGTAALLLDRDRRTVTRTVTNLSRTTRTFTAQVVRRARPAGQQRPSLRLAPGESADVTVRLVGHAAVAAAGVSCPGATRRRRRTLARRRVAMIPPPSASPDMVTA